MIKDRKQDMKTLFRGVFAVVAVMILASVALVSCKTNEEYDFEFKLPGGVSINYDKLADQADKDFDDIKEWAERNRGCDYFFQPNTL